MNEHVGSAASESPWKRILIALVGIGVFLLSKGKLLLLALSKIKFLSTSLSMLVSIAAYALIWSWPFAVGFVLLLLLHEMGHVLQLRREGIKASAPMFIPFLGAVIMSRSLGKDASAEARVGLAGPVLGSLVTLIPLSVWFLTGEDFWQALAFVGFFINLFNLLPVLPLDGGRAMAALSPKVWLVGYAMIFLLTVLTFSPILLLIMIFGGMEIYSRWKVRNTPEGQEYLKVPKRNRILIASVYFSLLVVLSLASYFTYLPKGLPS